MLATLWCLVPSKPKQAWTSPFLTSPGFEPVPQPTQTAGLSLTGLHPERV
jgi:hypothetical protein